MKRLYHKKRNLCLRINYDKLKSIFDFVDKNVVDYKDKVLISHKNYYSYLVNV